MPLLSDCKFLFIGNYFYESLRVIQKINEKALISTMIVGVTTRGHRAYTIAEDLVIMDAVLKELSGNTLETLDLPSFKEWKDVGDQIGRQESHIKYRWEYYLKTCSISLGL